MNLNVKKKKLLTMLLLVGMSTSALLESTVIMAAETENSCKAVVSACDRALSDQDKVIDLKTRQIGVQQDIITAQDTRIVELEKNKNNILTSPFFYLTLGIVAGVIIKR